MALAAISCSPANTPAETSAATSGATSQPSPTPPLATSLPSSESGGADAAQGLAAETECVLDGRRHAVVHLTWAPAADRGDGQVVELTIRTDGFEAGDVARSPDLPPDAGSWDGAEVRGAALHTWRVVTRHGAGSVASAPATFRGVVCPADSQ